MVVTIQRPVIKRCPHRPETDAGEILISIPGEAPELHELGELIDALCSRPITHEAFTLGVAAILPKNSQIVTTWNTGPWTVKVEEPGHAK